MLVRELTQCVLEGRACGPVIGFAVVLVGVFLGVGAGLWAWRRRRALPIDAARHSFLEGALVAWILFLLVGTLTPIGAVTNSLNLGPFNYLGRALALGGVDLRNALFDVVANVAVFVPLGVLVGLRFARPRTVEWLVEIACLMVAVEVAQAYALGRSGDITDVITNTIGAVIGLVVGRALRAGAREQGTTAVGAPP